MSDIDGQAIEINLISLSSQKTDIIHSGVKIICTSLAMLALTWFVGAIIYNSI